MEINHDDLSHDLLLLTRLTARMAVDDNDCWNWLGAKTTKGYGHLLHAGRLEYTRRLSARLFLALDRDCDLCVLHDCDNPSCFNPDHLRLGTQADNIADAVRKGRMGKKLTAEDALEIRRRLELGETQAKVAEDYPVSKSTIWQIAKRQTWKHLPEPSESRPDTTEDKSRPTLATVTA
jgi:hypothetical protein